MKKVLSLIFVFLFAFCLTGCGKSKNVTTLEELIDSIGEVTIESEEKSQKQETCITT